MYNFTIIVPREDEVLDSFWIGIENIFPGNPFGGAILINCLDCVGLVAVRSGFCGSTIYGIGLIHRGHCLNHGYALKYFNDWLLCVSVFFLLFQYNRVAT